jgi:hypothetical protein
MCTVDHCLDCVFELLAHQVARLGFGRDQRLKDRSLVGRAPVRHGRCSLQNCGHHAERLCAPSDEIAQNFAKKADVTPASADLRVSDAALRLAVTPQTVRNWIRSGTLKAKKQDGIWAVDAASIERCAAARPLRAARERVDGSTEKRLEDLAALVATLAAREHTADDLLEALQRERDRFRSEAASAKEAALRVNAAARETHAAVRQLLAVLELQTDALTQLLAPSSLQDLVP